MPPHATVDGAESAFERALSHPPLTPTAVAAPVHPSVGNAALARYVRGAGATSRRPAAVAGAPVAGLERAMAESAGVRRTPPRPVPRAARVARQPSRCRCGGVMGADGECARCKAARLAGPSAAASDLRGQANEAIQRLLREDAGRTAGSGPAVAERPLARQTVATPTGPGGGGCEDLLQAIIDLLNEVAQRFNDALNDPHGLYEHHRTPKDAHPDYGSWDGHRDRYNYDRDRLRHKLAEWDANDDCRGFRFNRQQQQDMDEAKEFADKEFPARPAPSLSRAQENEQSVWDKLRQHLPDHIVEILIGLGAVVVAGAVIACFATGVCEFAAVLGGVGYATAALIMLLLRQAGVRDEPAGGPIASAEPAPDDGLPSAAT